jgi:hypothetical protein
MSDKVSRHWYAGLKFLGILLMIGPFVLLYFRLSYPLKSFDYNPMVQGFNFADYIDCPGATTFHDANAIVPEKYIKIIQSKDLLKVILRSEAGISVATGLDLAINKYLAAHVNYTHNIQRTWCESVTIDFKLYQFLDHSRRNELKTLMAISENKLYDNLAEPRFGHLKARVIYKDRIGKVKIMSRHKYSHQLIKVEEAVAVFHQQVTSRLQALGAQPFVKATRVEFVYTTQSSIR